MDMLYALRDTLTTHRIVDARGIMLGLSVSIGWTCGMSPSGPVPDPLAERLSLIKAHLDQRAWRLLLGAEAKVLGRGGIKTVAAAPLAHPDTVARGVRDVDYPEPIPGRIRRPGAGRKGPRSPTRTWSARWTSWSIR